MWSTYKEKLTMPDKFMKRLDLNGKPARVGDIVDGDFFRAVHGEGKVYYGFKLGGAQSASTQCYSVLADGRILHRPGVDLDQTMEVVLIPESELGIQRGAPGTPKGELVWCRY